MSSNLFYTVMKTEIKNLSPAYFALVMATGIISIAAHLMEMNFIATTLFVLNNIFFFVLWILTILRLVWFPKEVISDMTNHMKGCWFFYYRCRNMRSGKPVYYNV